MMLHVPEPADFLSDFSSSVHVTSDVPPRAIILHLQRNSMKLCNTTIRELWLISQNTALFGMTPCRCWPA